MQSVVVMDDAFQVSRTRGFLWKITTVELHQDTYDGTCSIQWKRSWLSRQSILMKNKQNNKMNHIIPLNDQTIVTFGRQELHFQVKNNDKKNKTHDIRMRTSESVTFDQWYKRIQKIINSHHLPTQPDTPLIAYPAKPTQVERVERTSSWATTDSSSSESVEAYDDPVTTKHPLEEKTQVKKQETRAPIDTNPVDTYASVTTNITADHTRAMVVLAYREALMEETKTDHKTKRLVRRLAKVLRFYDTEALDTTNALPLRHVLDMLQAHVSNTPGNGNCQYYAIIEALTQASIQAASYKQQEQAIHKTTMLKMALEEAANINFNTEYKDGSIGHMAEYHVTCDASIDTQKQLLRQYFAQVADSSSALDEDIPWRLWGGHETLRQSAKVLGRPIFMIQEANQLNKCCFGLYKPSMTTTTTEDDLIKCTVVGGHSMPLVDWLKTMIQSIQAHDVMMPLIIHRRKDHYSSVMF